MKYETSNIKAVRNQKLKNNDTKTAPKKIESAKKIVSVNAALKSAKEAFIAKPTSNRAKVEASAKAKPKIQKIDSKKSVKANVKSEKSKTISAKTNKIVVRGTNEAVAKKTKQVVSKAKNVQTNAPVKAVKLKQTAKIQRAEAAVKPSKILKSELVARKIKISAPVKKTAPTGKQKQPGISANKAEKAKSTKLNAPVKVVKTAKINPTQSAKNPESASKKAKNVAVASKIKNKPAKIHPAVSAKKIDAAPKRTKTISLPKTGKTNAVKTVVSGKKANVKSAKTKQVASVVQTDVKSGAVQLVYSATTGRIIETKPVAAAEIKLNARKIKAESVAGNTNFAENKVKTVNVSAKGGDKKKKTKPIGAAVFRGKKERYDFKVFSIKEEIENVPAIYIISKRKTDKNNRGHHALVCIGQTDSISDEIKKHQKSKCVKKFEANVISILPEENEKKRVKIEADLRAAHTIDCNLKQ